MPENANLVLGTAQLGMTYGIANKSGQPDQDGVEEIVRTAWENGIRKFDTAQAYGESEIALGKAFTSLEISDQVKVITKLDPKLDHLDIRAMENATHQSLSNLGIPKLHGLMLHQEGSLGVWNQGLRSIMQNLVDRGLADNIGVSVYTTEMALRTLDIDAFSFVQIPASIVDHRFERAGVFAIAKKKRKQIFIRSVFLQGLLLMRSLDLSDEMAFARPVIEQLEMIVQRSGLLVQQMALGYLHRRFPDANVVFGAETALQVQ
jgi:aryl-alcohol dehydrogenase-like predicted oxidoreductase